MVQQEEKVPVTVGVLDMSVLKQWAQGSKRFTEVMSEESRFQEAVDAVQKELRERGVPEKYIKHIGPKRFCESIKENIVVSYARAATEGFFQRKTEAEIESETLSNPEWLGKTVEETVEWLVNVTVQSVNHYEEIMLIASLFGGDEDDDDEEHDRANSDGE